MMNERKDLMCKKIALENEVPDSSETALKDYGPNTTVLKEMSQS